MSVDHARNRKEVDQYETSRSQLFVAGAIAGTTLLGSIALIAPFVIGYARTPLPYMATPAIKVNRALRFVKERCQHKQKQSTTACWSEIRNIRAAPSLNFLDLGSGDGEAVYQAAQLGFHKSVGIELNWTLYFICQFRRNFWWSSDERRRTSFYCQDFFTTSPTLISQSDALMIFGVPSLMNRISGKLAKHCSPGAFILSYRFPLPISTNTSTLQTVQQTNAKQNEVTLDLCSNTETLLKAELIYDEEEMRVYKCM